MEKKEFQAEPKVTATMKTMAESLINENVFKLLRENLYEYKQRNGEVIQIKTSDKTCLCKIYYDKRICKHLVAGCIKDKVPFMTG